MLRVMIRPAVLGMVPNWPPLSPMDQKVVQFDAVDHVMQVLKGAPLHFRIGVCVLAAVFALTSAVLGGGQSYAQQTQTARARIDRIWAKLGGPAQGYVRLVRSLTVMSALEHPLARQAMDLETDMARQHRFRQLRQISDANENFVRVGK